MKEALVIDDNRQMADVLVEMLKLVGVAARAAYGASAGMAILSIEVPPLILLDINMPGVDGFEILAYLKREPRLAPVPVIVVSSDDQPETQRRALQIGALAFVVKPPTLDRLEEALKKAKLLK